MGLAVFSLRTYFLHQRKFLFPVVLHYWEEYRGKLLDQLKGVPGAVWSGDGIFDSMGHCAMYGTYTMFSCDLMKIVHFDILQVSNIIMTLHTTFNSSPCIYMYDLLKPSDMANFLNCLSTCGDCQIISMYVFSLAFFTHVVGFLLSSEAVLLYLLDFFLNSFLLHYL